MSPTARLYILGAAATIIIVSLAVQEKPVTPPADDKQAAIVQEQKADAAIDPEAIKAWQNAVVKAGLDPARFNAVYMNDPRTYSVFLIPLNAEGKPDAFPAYELTIERGSNRVMGFRTADEP